MSESKEILNSGIEASVETQSAAAERSAELAKNTEASVEQSPERQAEALEQARVEANKEALAGKERSGAEKKRGGEPTASSIRKVTKKEKDAAYQQTMKEVQSQMSVSERTFSKVIHSPVVEKTSEIMGKSVARPNALLAGSTAAFMITLLVYLVAKHYGYLLSGFEAVGAFVIGWAIGLMFDYFRLLVTGGRQA